MDFEGIVDMGLSQMLSSIANHETDATLDVCCFPLLVWSGLVNNDFLLFMM